MDNITARTEAGKQSLSQKVAEDRPGDVRIFQKAKPIKYNLEWQGMPTQGSQHG